MTAIEQLRKSCDELRCEHQAELINALVNFKELSFIYPHRPWRAVVGNKKCKPIPIHRYIRYPENVSITSAADVWPHVSKGFLRRELENLGFIVTGERMYLSVPPVEHGKPLTFAQQYVKDINDSYSIYCQEQKEFAITSYLKLLSLLQSEVENGNAYTFDDYTFFPDFKVPEDSKVTIKCCAFFLHFVAFYIKSCYNIIRSFFDTFQQFRRVAYPPNISLNIKGGKIMFVKCRMCRGKGHLFTAGVGMGSPCPICKGKGGFEIPEGKKLCPKCDGKKTIPMRICEGLSFETICDKCFGDGFVDK